MIFINILNITPEIFFKIKFIIKFLCWNFIFLSSIVSVLIFAWYKRVIFFFQIHLNGKCTFRYSAIYWLTVPKRCWKRSFSRSISSSVDVVIAVFSSRDAHCIAFILFNLNFVSISLNRKDGWFPFQHLLW